MISVCAASTEEMSVGSPARLKEAVDDRLAAVGRQVERQAGPAEGFTDLLEHLGGARLAAVDLVDHDQAADAACLREVHHPVRHRLDAVDGAHDDHRGFDRLERGQRAAEKIRIARGIDDVDAMALRARSRRSRHRASAAAIFPAGRSRRPWCRGRATPSTVSHPTARARLRPAASCPRLLGPRARGCGCPRSCRACPSPDWNCVTESIRPLWH